MKKYYTLVVLSILIISSIQGQITNEGQPLSWKQSNLKKSLAYEMEEVDMVAIQKEDEINDQDISKPFRFGFEFNVNLGLKNAGTWDELKNGDRIWRINIVSSGAKTMNFIFDKYKVPEGASLYVYTNDRTDLLGAYTHVMNNKEKMLGTWIVEGDNVWIEYHEPRDVSGQGELHIEKVIHGYRMKTSKDFLEKALNDSGNCNHDVDCSVGSDFDSLKDRLKHSVAFIIMGSFVCSGQLINNTNNDQSPYFLTANHCSGSSPTSAWVFRFNWISPDPICAATTNSTDTSVVQTTSGATNLATNANSDVRLMELTGGLNSSWDLEWAGWDRTDNVPNYVVGIHHPSGDIMKVCRDDDPMFTSSINFNGDPTTQMWTISGASFGGGNGWDIGVTEGGSSGSAIFNESGHIVGQLAGGQAACSGTNDNSQWDVYGRFAVSWDDNNFGQWLDPTSTGATTLNMYTQVLSSYDEEVLNSSIDIYPNPSDGMFTVKNRTGSELEYVIYSLLGKTVKKGNLSDFDDELDLTSMSGGMYILKITQGSSSIQKKIILN